jgi:phage tail-like protein
MPPGQGTGEGRYLFEFDGVVSIRASRVTGISKDHKEFELFVGNQANPFLGRGTFTCGDIVVRHAHALNGSATEVFDWMDGYVRGNSDAEKRGGRLIIMDEAGRTPLRTYELIDCVPKSFKEEDHDAGGSGAAYFTFTIRPTDWDLL